MLDHARQMRDMAHLELCQVDIEIASYQLTCGMIGLNKDHTKLWECANNLYRAMMYVTKNLGKVKDKKQYQKTLLELKQMAPTQSYSSKELARCIDSVLLGLKTLLQAGEITVENESKRNGLIYLLSQILQKCITSLDDVLEIVVESNKNVMI